MSTIGSITSQTASSSNTDQAGLIGDYSTFLTMLTTQLQHQDPMEPMDASQFTDQLVQFSAVEQQIKSNEQLENLSAMMTASNALGVLNFVGTEVSVDGSTGKMSAYGDIDFGFSSDAAGTAEITIRNENGDIVANYTDIEIKEGEQTFTWDGTDGSGNRMGEGTYTIQINAKDANSNALDIDTTTKGIVEDIDFSSNEPLLLVNDQRITTAQIISVSTPSTS